MNTRNKRASSVQLLLASILAPPAPLGGIDQTMRQQIAWTYAGLLVTGQVFLSTRLERSVRGLMRGILRGVS